MYTSVYLQLHNTVHCDTPRDRFLHCYSRREPTSTQEEEKKKKKGILTQATDQHPKKKIKKNVARIANSVQVTTTNPQCHYLSFSICQELSTLSLKSPMDLSWTAKKNNSFPTAFHTHSLMYTAVIKKMSATHRSNVSFLIVFRLHNVGFVGFSKSKFVIFNSLKSFLFFLRPFLFQLDGNKRGFMRAVDEPPVWTFKV